MDSKYVLLSEGCQVTVLGVVILHSGFNLVHVNHPQGVMFNLLPRKYHTIQERLCSNIVMCCIGNRLYDIRYVGLCNWLKTSSCFATSI